jgi:hypothetical protein
MSSPYAAARPLRSLAVLLLNGFFDRIHGTAPYIFALANVSRPCYIRQDEYIVRNRAIHELEEIVLVSRPWRLARQCVEGL